MVLPVTPQDGERKTYSKRERKPNKRFEFEDNDLTKQDDESKSQQKTGPGSGRKRGRPPKQVKGESGPIVKSKGDQTSTEAIHSENLETQELGIERLPEQVETVENIVNRKRGRPRKSYHDKSLTEDKKQKDFGSSPSVPDYSVGKRQRPRSLKIKEYGIDEINDEKSVCENDVSNMEETCQFEEQNAKRPGRKRKRIDYSVLNDGSSEDTETVATSDRRRRKSDQVLEGSDVTYSEKTRGTPGRPKKKPKKVMELKCPKCDRLFHDRPSIQRHTAIEHQIWWTAEHPEGEDDKIALRKVIKIKTFLNCPKCNKRVNFLQYFFHHVEWCGRENETYTCEICGHRNLKAVWRSQHYVSCVGKRKVAEESLLEEEAEDESKDEDQNEDLEGGRQRKRKAAKKAMSVVKKISKNMNDGDDDDNADDDDKDPDAKVADDEEDDDDDDDNLDDDIDEEEKEESNNESEEWTDEEGIGKPGTGTGTNKRVSYGGRSGQEFAKYFDTHPLMLKLMEKNYSRTVFSDLLPKRAEWNLLDNGDRDRYIPKRQKSIKFTSADRGDPVGLKLFESTNVHGFPILFTGLCVWKVAWCTMPIKCADDQYLAVVGKTDPSDPFLTSNYSGPGVIQIWNVTSLTAKMPGDSVPQLWYMVAHEFGLATQIKWCPSGCYKSNIEKMDSETYPRLGLLATSFTDGSIRIFSLPILPPPDSEKEVRIYKPSPVLTLNPSSHMDNIEISCSCLDWVQVNSHEKILAGYSDGSVRVFNLQEKNPPLFFKFDKKDGGCLFPYQSFRPHRKLVRTVSWVYRHEDMVITACENFDTYVWHLNDTEFPLFQDPPVHMLTSVASSLFHPGIFAGSDDNYALNTNRARYFEISNIYYTTVTKLRKDEVMEFNLSSQSACIWEVSMSDWFSYVLSCDNRGNIHGMPMANTMEYQLCLKAYKFRQLLLTIDEKHTKVENKTEEAEDKEGTHDCNQSSCVKSSAIQKTADNGLCNGQSNEALQTNVGSESAMEEIDDRTENPSKMRQSDGGTQITNYPEKPSYGSDDSTDVHLKFNYHFKAPLMGVIDTDRDQYSKLSHKALKTIAINPNHLQCTWIAFGGDSGLIHLANIHKVLPQNAQRHLEKKSFNTS